ncbi:TetR family transcriptional regulator [Motiliproteus coralliicola]|uniref:TetR family transcriptional regulator n=1 Tax=Motiliproteus coralliicola TaxID=2283196 RepID=A0A369WSY5_9GAMM|nr:TetR family transcriptional regulator [Motiliproteus coralliicola]RDE25210.1 TetR family transcriptional regulator [Motiliproteus coralliicola]
MARKTKQEAEQTYHALLDAAGRLFIRQGVATTTLNQIAAEAKMTRGAIYWHFKNKDAVVQALWERNAETLHHGFAQLLLKLDTEHPARAFRQALKQILQSLASEPELGQMMKIVMHNIEFTEQQTELHRYLAGKKEEIWSAMAQAFELLAERDGLKVALPPALLAQGLMSYTHGLLHSHLSPSQDRAFRLDLEQHGDRLLDLYLDAVLKESEH